MKARLLRRLPVAPHRVAQGFPPFYEAEHVIDHPKAYRLVQQGVAVPADKECEEKARMTQAALDHAIWAYERTTRGIDLEHDADAYARGLMVGYQEDGTWEPGPNWKPGCEEEYYDNQEEDDDDDE